MMNSSPPQKSLWPLGIAAALLIFAGGLAVLIVLALSSNSDLVVEDYYEQEILYDQQLDRLARTESLSEPIEVRYDASLRVVVLSFPKDHASADLTGEVHLYRPSAAGLDRRVPLTLNAAGMQVLPAADLAPGQWQVKILWTLAGEEYYFEQRLTIKGDAA